MTPAIIGRRLLVVLVLLASVGLALSGCSTKTFDTAESGTAADTDSASSDSPDHEMGHDHDGPSSVAPGARSIDVSARSFEFGPQEITVAAGEDIAIVLSSEDVFHDFTIDDVGVHVAADRGETVSGGLRIDVPGTYSYYCTVPGHREAGMEGTVTVEQA